jgi:hypothetical protein
MRKDAFTSTVALLMALLACGGIASARCTSVPVAGRLVPKAAAQPGTRGTLVLEELGSRARVSLPVECGEACTFTGSVPPGLYRASAGGAFAMEGHPALLSERLDLRAASTDLRLQASAPITVAGALGEKGDRCPLELPAITFRRSADGEEFGAVVTCANGQGPGFVASIEPGVYEVKVDLPGGRAAIARSLPLRTDVADLPLGVLLPDSRGARVARF